VIQSIVRFSIERPAVVAGIAVVLCFFGVSAAVQLPKDALPEIGETQVIVYSEWDRDPSLLENQVTYPIVTRLMSVPHIKTVRGISDFGRSFVYAVFEDGTDLYWARNAVQQTHFECNRTNGACHATDRSELRGKRLGCRGTQCAG
jgi:copper/silver efflux system protein